MPFGKPSIHLRALAVAGALASCVSPSALAQGAKCQPATRLSTCITADNLWPQPGGGPWASLYPVATTPPGLVGFGLTLSYISRPIALRMASADPEGTTIYAVDNALDATFVAALGVTDELQLSLALPVVLYQDGAGIADVVGSQSFLPRSAMGDLRVGLGLALLKRAPEDDGLALTSHFDLAIPSGDTDAFASAGTAAYAPGLSLAHRVGRFEWGVDGGARIRDTRALAGARVGSQIVAAAGASVDILADHWLSAGLETFWLFTLVGQRELVWDPARHERVSEISSSPHIPAEWLLGVRSAGLLDGELATSLAGGGFVPTGEDSAVTTPRFRLLASIEYVPSAPEP